MKLPATDVDGDDLRRAALQQAIAEADLVLFLVDAKGGRAAGDENIAEMLRQNEIPSLLVANKIDGQNSDFVAAEFYALGDLERKHGLSPTELFQRSKPVDEVQIGFTSFFVRPLYEALGQVKGFDATGMLANIDCNLAYWQRVKTARESPRVESSQTVTECGKRTKRRRRNAMVFSMLGKETVDFLQTLVEG